MFNKKKKVNNSILDDVLKNDKKSIRDKTNKARKLVFWRIVRAHFKFSWQFSKILMLAKLIDVRTKLLMFLGKWFQSLNISLIGQLYDPYDRRKEKFVTLYDRSKRLEDSNVSFVRKEGESLLDIDESEVYGWNECVEDDKPSVAETLGIKPIEVSCSDEDKPYQKEGSGFNLSELAVLIEKEKKNLKSNKNMN